MKNNILKSVIVGIGLVILITLNVNIQEVNAEGVPKNLFKDVKENHWGISAVNYGNLTGIIDGYSDGNFKPNDKLTEAQMVKIIVNYKYENEMKAYLKAYGKVNAKEWYTPYYKFLNSKGYALKGLNNSKEANSGITKGETAQLIYFVLENKKVSELEAVKYMLKNGYSNVKIVNGNILKSYDSKGELVRIQGAAFIERINNKKIKDTFNGLEMSLGNEYKVKKVNNSNDLEILNNKKEVVGYVYLDKGDKIYNQTVGDALNEKNLKCDEKIADYYFEKEKNSKKYSCIQNENKVTYYYIDRIDNNKLFMVIDIDLIHVIKSLKESNRKVIKENHDDLAKLDQYLINVLRENNGLYLIEYNKELSKVASVHNDDLTANSIFSHTGSDGSLPWDRAKNLRYNYRYYGENLSNGYLNIFDSLLGLYNSKGHRDSILATHFTEVGSSITLSNNEGLLLVQNYATPKK